MFESWAAVTALCALATCATLIIGSFLRYEKRQTKNEGVAIDALQAAAEADENVKEITNHVDALRREIHDDAGLIRREFGETVRALATKVQDFEIWARDEFVRKNSFQVIVDRMEANQEARDIRLEKRLDRIDMKLDGLPCPRDV